MILIFKFLSENVIGGVGATKIGEGVANMLNLTHLNLNF